jgi:hypothetical protein
MTSTDDGGSRALTPWERLKRGGPLPAQPASEAEPDFAAMSDDEKRRWISRLDPKEARIAWIGAAAAVLLDMAFVLPYLISKIKVNDPTVKPSHGACPAKFTYAHSGGKAICEVVYPSSHYVLALVLPLVFAAAIVVTLRFRRRPPTAFALVMTGLALGQIYLLLPFALAGGWMLLRAYRVQKYGAPNAKTVRPGWTPPPPRQGRAAQSRGRRPSSGAAGATKSATRKAPTANKRYTPRTPPKPAKKP